MAMKMQNAKNNELHGKSILVKFLGWLQQMNIYWLVILPLVISIFLLSGLLFIGSKICEGKISEVYYSVSGAICLMIASLSGLAQLIKREGPGLFGQPVYGIWPIISGSILIIICWAIAFALLAYAIRVKFLAVLGVVLIALGS
jgi:hypothetical protein